MDIDFDGKVYLVTGGASGIGAAVVSLTLHRSVACVPIMALPLTMPLRLA